MDTLTKSQRHKCECQPKSEPLAHEFLSHLSIRHLPFAAVQTVRLSIHI